LARSVEQLIIRRLEDQYYSSSKNHWRQTAAHKSTECRANAIYGCV